MAIIIRKTIEDVMKITVHLPLSLHGRLGKLALARNVSINRFIRSIVSAEADRLDPATEAKDP